MLLVGGGLYPISEVPLWGGMRESELEVASVRTECRTGSPRVNGLVLRTVITARTLNKPWMCLAHGRQWTVPWGLLRCGGRGVEGEMMVVQNGGASLFSGELQKRRTQWRLFPHELLMSKKFGTHALTSVKDVL